MNALTRFLSRGMEDADRRVAAALVPPSPEPADRYLMNSVVVTEIDRATLRLRDWWLASQSGQWLGRCADSFSSTDWRERYRTIAIVVLTSVVVHVALTLFQGPRPGWFWMAIPALAALFGSILLLASRTPPSTH